MGNYNSTEETQAHIRRVRELLDILRLNLEERGLIHDDSKLLSPEKEAFDEVVGTLKGLTYGSPEYKAQLAKLGPALQHHYEFNSHHPEHFKNGVAGMSLLDIVEMFCDWKAAGERHADGSMAKSIQINAKRFGMSDQLVDIFESTRRELGWP